MGDSPELNQTLDGAGFHVSQKNSETLAQEAGIEGLPCLLIINPAGRTVYAGGYARQNPATVAALEDLALLQRAQSGGVPDPLPLFGCAASQRLKLALDPLGLKYSSRPPMNRP